MTMKPLFNRFIMKNLYIERTPRQRTRVHRSRRLQVIEEVLDKELSEALQASDQSDFDSGDIVIPNIWDGGITDSQRTGAECSDGAITDSERASLGNSDRKSRDD